MIESKLQITIFNLEIQTIPTFHFLKICKKNWSQKIIVIFLNIQTFKYVSNLKANFPTCYPTKFSRHIKPNIF